LAAQNTGKAELLAVLPSDSRLIDEARLFLKTQKFVQQNTGDDSETRKAILDQRGQQNSIRRNAMQQLASEFLSRAPLYLNGSRLDTVAEERLEIVSPKHARSLCHLLSLIFAC
jgi:hypothetical protein